jgi:hypothetical protein
LDRPNGIRGLFCGSQGSAVAVNSQLIGLMHTVPTPQQSLAMAYARFSGLRADIAFVEPNALETLCTGFNRVLDDLATAGFDLSSFKLDGEEQAEERSAWLRARLDAILDYLDLIAGLP